MKIARLLTPHIFREQPSETQDARYLIEECDHSWRGVKLAPLVIIGYNKYIEYCRDCGEVTRTKVT